MQTDIPGENIAPIIPADLSPEQTAQFVEKLALETLATIAKTGTSEPARVSASKELLDRARGKPTTGPAMKQLELEFQQDDSWDRLLNPQKPTTGRTN